MLNDGAKLCDYLLRNRLRAITRLYTYGNIATTSGGISLRVFSTSESPAVPTDSTVKEVNTADWIRWKVRRKNPRGMVRANVPSSESEEEPAKARARYEVSRAA